MADEYPQNNYYMEVGIGFTISRYSGELKFMRVNGNKKGVKLTPFWVLKIRKYGKFRFILFLLPLPM